MVAKGDQVGNQQLGVGDAEQVNDEHGCAVMGGAAETVAERLRETYTEGADLATAVRAAVAALGHSEATDRVIPVVVLERA